MTAILKSLLRLSSTVLSVSITASCGWNPHQAEEPLPVSIARMDQAYQQLPRDIPAYNMAM